MNNLSQILNSATMGQPRRRTNKEAFFVYLSDKNEFITHLQSKRSLQAIKAWAAHRQGVVCKQAIQMIQRRNYNKIESTTPKSFHHIFYYSTIYIIFAHIKQHKSMLAIKKKCLSFS